MTMTSHPWPPELLAGALRQIAILRRMAQIIARGPRACGNQRRFA